MKRLFLAAALAALTLPAAQAVTCSWTRPTGDFAGKNAKVDFNNNLSIVAKITVSDTLSDTQAYIFNTNADGFGGLTFRIAGKDDPRTDGTYLGIHLNTNQTAWVEGSTQVELKAGETYILTLAYGREGNTNTVTCYVNNEVIFTASNTYPTLPQVFLNSNNALTASFKLEGFSGWDGPLTAEEVAHLVQTQSTDGVPEPTALALLALGAAGLALRRRAA